MPLPEIVSVDHDLANLSRRHERALDQGSFDLADTLRTEIDRLLDKRIELTSEHAAV